MQTEIACVAYKTLATRSSYLSTLELPLEPPRPLQPARKDESAPGKSDEKIDARRG